MLVPPALVMLKTLQASLESQSVEDVTETPTVHEKLWVDKYAPKSFTELLSDEQTNREVHIQCNDFSHGTNQTID